MAIDSLPSSDPQPAPQATHRPGLGPPKQIVLPSRGALYDGKIPDGKVGIRKLTVGEDAVLLAGNMSIEDRVNAIIDRTCILPNNFRANDLLITDRVYIMMAVRMFSFGPWYTYQFKCQQCGAMNTKCKINLIEELNDKRLPEGVTEPLSFTLPEHGAVVTLRFLRGYDEEAITKYAKRRQAMDDSIVDPSYVHRLARQIKTIDGQEVSIVDRETWVTSLPAIDGIALTKFLDDNESGIDTTIYPECRKCQSANEMRMPMSIEFFRPTDVRAAGTA